MTTLSVSSFRWAFLFLLGMLTFSPIGASAGMTPEEVKQFEDYKAKAEKGDAVSQYNVGVCHAKGEGVAMDDMQAVWWYRKAAEQGLALAQYDLAVRYDSGKGIERDNAAAIRWYRKSAEQGYGPAQSNMGVCYATGEGVLKDEIEAYAYWNLAGITLEEARKNLAILEKNLSRDEIAAGQKRSKELQKEIEAKIAAKKAGK
jgi:TPR repeat protein